MKSAIYDLLYLRPCRIYSRYFVKDKPADTFFQFLCGFRFFRIYHFWPDFKNPRRFSEKLWNRMLIDRNPQLTLMCDKLLVRSFVSTTIGSDYLVPILWSGKNPKEIPFDMLPSRYVIKTNHGSSFNIIVRDKLHIDENEVREKLAEWLKANYALNFFLGIEWGYKNINPCIIIESFIGEDDNLPTDYKFYCFSGRAEIITIHIDRYGSNQTKAFDRNFRPFKFKPDFAQFNGEFSRPSNLKEMLTVAETLSRDFAFMRVDLYSLKNKVYFGEISPYPGGISSLRGFDVSSLDYFLGEKWKSR